MSTRLDIVCTIVRAAQAMPKAGVGRSAQTRILRETIFYVWESQSGTKFGGTRLRSKSARMNPKAKPEYDHVIPLNIAIDRLLRSSAEPNEVKSILDEWVLSCLITRDEHARLKDLGLQSSMPGDWNGRDKFARYKTAGIEISD